MDPLELNASQVVQSDALAREMGMTHDDLKGRRSFWTHKGYIRAHPQVDIKPPSLRKQQSFNEVDTEIIYYYPVK
jgi:hypothetical protein